MPPVRIDAGHFSPDTATFIELLHAHRVRYLVVGGEAVIFHGHVRLTGDVDFFCARDAANLGRLFEAVMVSEGAETPIAYIGVSELMKNKRAVGRPKDLDDLNYLSRKR